MNKYIIGTVLLAVVFIVTTYNLKSDKSTNIQIASAITVIKDSHDFGDIDIFGGKVKTTYILKNEGTIDVNIISAVTSCMCTEGEIGDLKFGMHKSSDKIVIIQAGTEKTLTATFDPLAHGPDGTGKIKRELILKTNSTLTPNIKVTFSGNVTK